MLIFAAYAAGVLATLLLAGQASDQVGRKPVMAAALGFSSLAPGFVSDVLHHTNYAAGGTVSFLIFAAACVAQLSLARFNSRPVTLAGLGLFLAGLALVVAGMSAASLGLFVVGTVVGGVAVGALFIGSLSTANRLAPTENRAQVLSTYFVFAYCGLIIPVVGVGIAADYVGDYRAVLGGSIALGALCVFSAVVISGSERSQDRQEGGRSRPRQQGPRPRRQKLVRRQRPARLQGTGITLTRAGASRFG